MPFRVYPERHSNNNSNIKVNENEFTGSRVVPYGRMDVYTDTTKLIAAFRDFSNKPKMYYTQKTRVSQFTKLRTKAEVNVYYKYTRNKIQRKMQS